MAATLGQVIALLKLLLPEVAGHHRSAVGIHAVSEVLASQTDSGSLPVLKLFLIHKIPLLHRPPPSGSANVLTRVGVWSSQFRKAFGITRSGISAGLPGVVPGMTEIARQDVLIGKRAYRAWLMGQRSHCGGVTRDPAMHTCS